MKLTAYYYHAQETLVLQGADYIEGGGYIEIKGSVFSVLEIPEGGGQEELIKKCDTIHEAFEIMEKLT